MNEEIKKPEEMNQSPEEQEVESYGWEFHKMPLLYALILTVLFYAFIFFYVNL